MAQHETEGEPLPIKRVISPEEQEKKMGAFVAQLRHTYHVLSMQGTRGGKQIELLFEKYHEPL